MAQNIEFFLHPPSPKSTIDHCTLPPVSSLLYDTNISSLCLSPRATLDTLDPYPIHETISLPSLSPFMDSLSLDSPPPPGPPPPPHCRLLLPLPTNTRTRSLSNASSNSSCSLNSILNDDPVEPPKRKRGRPPNSTRPATQRDHWTFVTPTVWDVKHTQQLIDPKPEKDDSTVLHWPVQEGQNDFTNTSMNTSLSMPKKKRGRKPKMQLAGNFCFVWRDLTARRSANREKINRI
ncbi:hypothetical protein EDC94DRAFT_624059 [Helicostylum pulchrum]|nr:hypothetical protein EDC94DRAFT_624059 [Helicostylum pulchrum]